MKHIIFLLLGILLAYNHCFAQCEGKYVNSQTLNVRKSPEQNAEVVATRTFGQWLMVDTKNVLNGYVPLLGNDCKTIIGYVWATYLTDKDPQNHPTYSNPQTNPSRGSGNCGPAGVQLHRGSRGGCYYYSGNSKVYVDRSCCQ